MLNFKTGTNYVNQRLFKDPSAIFYPGMIAEYRVNIGWRVSDGTNPIGIIENVDTICTEADWIEIDIFDSLSPKSYSHGQLLYCNEKGYLTTNDKQSTRSQCIGYVIMPPVNGILCAYLSFPSKPRTQMPSTAQMPSPTQSTISGATCIKCKEYNAYADALDSYICYRCRNGI